MQLTKEQFEEKYKTYIADKYQKKIDIRALEIARAREIALKGKKAKIVRHSPEYEEAKAAALFSELRKSENLQEAERIRPVWECECEAAGKILSIEEALNIQKRKIRLEENEKTEEFFGTDNFLKWAREFVEFHKTDVVAKAKSDTENYFANITPEDVNSYYGEIRMSWNSYTHRYEEYDDDDEDEDDDDWEDQVELFTDPLDEAFILDSLEDIQWHVFCDIEPKLDEAGKNGLKYDGKLISKIFCGLVKEAGIPKQIEEMYAREFDEDARYDLVIHNKNFEELIRERDEERKEREREKKEREKELLDYIPERAVDAYPEARAMKRHFVLHIGPTNSGKTHDAVEMLKAAKSGVYLGPLRLLAYEQFEKLNAEGVSCSLLTGEEETKVDGACICSSTIEMANFDIRYDVAVIDEAQMMGDTSRGGAWTAAILGLRSDTIAVCAAPEAEKLLVRLIEECGDTYEIVKHERKTDLQIDVPFIFPQDVQQGDALIVFSRRNVHAVAAELKKKGVSCSIIYGSLPYDVRHKQAERFASGETDVVVSTDAIGMGMNLPIRRVVFLEQKKYDGISSRELTPSETQQIAGRAGRFGMYDIGYVTAFGQNKVLTKNILAKITGLTVARLSFPRSLLGVSGKLSQVMADWSEMPDEEGYRKVNVGREIELAEEMEASVPDNKIFVYKFVTIPFDEQNVVLREIWRAMYKAEIEGDEFPVKKNIPSVWQSDELRELEEKYKICDLLYSYCSRFGHDEDVLDIETTKHQISDKIFTLLRESKLEQRRCKYCGRTLPWNYPYGMCQRCHDERYSYRGDWSDDNWDY